MDFKKYLPLIILSLAGCTTTARLTRQDISAMRIDCANQKEQIAFLRSQMITGDEYLINGLMITSSVGFVSSVADGTYEQRRDFGNGYNSGINLKIDQIRNQCALQSLSQHR